MIDKGYVTIVLAVGLLLSMNCAVSQTGGLNLFEGNPGRLSNVASNFIDSIDLTGVWNCDDDGIYYIRQLGNSIWWYGEKDPNTPEWSNVMYGTIDGDIINGNWADVPKGRVMQNGVMVVKIESNNRLRVIQKTGGFAGSVWGRGDRGSDTYDSADLSGKWDMVANTNYNFILDLQQSGNQITGTMTSTNMASKSVETISGTISGETIQFTREGAEVTQVYTGSVFGSTITGRFNQDGQGQYPWSASKMQGSGQNPQIAIDLGFVQADKTIVDIINQGSDLVDGGGCKGTPPKCGQGEKAICDVQCNCNCVADLLDPIEDVHVLASDTKAKIIFVVNGFYPGDQITVHFGESGASVDLFTMTKSVPDNMVFLMGDLRPYTKYWFKISSNKGEHFSGAFRTQPNLLGLPGDNYLPASLIT
ncbi:MAG: hypothetical protein NTY37_04980 [Methanothrix sp.]|nr:hypothetical protein [Methanothrix sp.]